MRKIESIQALRGFAAISVVLTHMSFIDPGAYGVDIFFVISGYLMMYSTKDNLKDYWKKKFFRIVPFYWFMTILTAAAVVLMPGMFNSYEVSGTYLLKSLFFIPYEHSGIYQPVLGLGYTLNYEILFYFIFYIAARIAMRCKYKNRGYICIGLIVSFMFLKLFEIPMPFLFWCNYIMLDFLLGILCYYVMEAVHLDTYLEHRGKIADGISVFFILISIVFLWYGAVYTPAEEWRVLLWGIPSLILFLAVYSWRYGKKLPAFLILTGNISYYIYLTHPYCIRLTEKVIGRICHNEMAGHILMVFVGILSSVFCGYIVSLFIKKVSMIRERYYG